MKRILTAILLLSLPMVLAAQITRPLRPRAVATLPGGSCSERDFIQTVDTSLTYICQAAAWVLMATSGAATSNPQFNSVGIGQTASGTAGTLRLTENVSGLNGVLLTNSNTGGQGVLQITNDTPTTFNLVLNGSATANSTLTNLPNSGLANVAGAGGLVLLASNGAGIIRFGTGGGLLTAERWRIDASGNFTSPSGSSLTTTGSATFGTAASSFDTSGSLVMGAGRLLSTPTGAVNAQTYTTNTNCADSAGAAACGSASAGSFVIDAATTSTVVSTTAVTANSEIIIQEDSSLGTRLGITCNTQSVLIIGPPVVTARTAATSFTVSIVVGPTTTPACYSYHLVN